MQFNWPLSGAVEATLTVSRQIEEDDIETLSSYFDIAKIALKKAAVAERLRRAAQASAEAEGGHG